MVVLSRLTWKTPPPAVLTEHSYGDYEVTIRHNKLRTNK